MVNFSPRAQTKRALEMDLSSYQKTIHQLAQDNQELRRQLETLTKEHQSLKEFQSESIYLQEENADALERITGVSTGIERGEGDLDQSRPERKKKP